MLDLRPRGARRFAAASIAPVSAVPQTAAWDDLLTGEEVAHRTVEPAREGRDEPLPEALDPLLVSALVRQGHHVGLASPGGDVEAAARGEHVIVATGTASGKSLAFNLPVLDAIAAEPRTRALYLYPTKALAQDQARALAALGLKGLRPAIYDGDTELERRWHVRRFANAILTNPDMLHVGVLPHHDRWADVLHNLRYVVVDEAHVYRGVFGSHVANVLRRLRRLARVYGAEPQFLLASATIANPAELALALTGEPATVVDRDAAPRSEREVVLWNPPLLDQELGQRASALADASRLLASLVERGLRTICFSKSRKAAELVHRFTAQRVGPNSQHGSRRTAPAIRRSSGASSSAGWWRATCSGSPRPRRSSLGIDIGLLDCAISVGFPGTVASLRQQWGRAGRKSRGLAVLIAGEDALDQFFMREPDALLSRRVEAARLDHANPRILDPHVLAAAYEGPLDELDADTLGSAALARAAELPELERTAAGWTWTGRDYPAARVGLRSGDPEAFTVVEEETGSVLGLVEREKAYGTVHEGAVYLHLGEQYLVQLLDHEARTALVVPAAVDWYTQIRKETETAIEESLRSTRLAGVELHFGRVSVTEQVVGYARKADRRRLDARARALELPETTFETEAVWFSPSDDLLAGLEEMPCCLELARRRALADRSAAVVGDVRPLGHRRPVHERPFPDRPPHDLRLRRARRRSRHRRARLRALPGLGRGHRTPPGRLPLHGRLPLMRAEPEVRQSQRPARQGGGANAPSTDGRCGADLVRHRGEHAHRKGGNVEYLALIYADEGADRRSATTNAGRGTTGTGRSPTTRGQPACWWPATSSARPRTRRPSASARSRWRSPTGRTPRPRRPWAATSCSIATRSTRRWTGRRAFPPPSTAPSRSRGARGRRGGVMKYALLVYGDQSGLEKPQRRGEGGRPRRVDAALDRLLRGDRQGRSGTAKGWGSTSLTAKTVRVRDGQTLVTDGPFVETKELIGGVFSSTSLTSTRRSASRR